VSEAVVEFRDVVKQYPGARAVDGLSVAFPAGRLIGFLGPNGAGKTTSFRAMLGLTRLTSGSIDVLGMRVGTDTPRIVKRVGAVIEEPGLYKTLHATDNMRVAADVLGHGHDRIDDLLAFVELSEVASRKVGQYSKGMRQRLALAQAMLGDPDLLILDEPLDGLDPGGQRVLKQQLRALVTERGKSVVVSSHDLADVEELADHVVVISRGRLIVSGTLDEVTGTSRRHRVQVADAPAAQVVLEQAGMAVTRDAGDLIVLDADGEDISRRLAGAGIYASALIPMRSTLESVFLDLTAEGIA
jgi:lantibiotic transport system ATP-binding protein